jgi:hypothetical protein
MSARYPLPLSAAELAALSPAERAKHEVQRAAYKAQVAHHVQTMRERGYIEIADRVRYYGRCGKRVSGRDCRLRRMHEGEHSPKWSES